MKTEMTTGFCTEGTNMKTDSLLRFFRLFPCLFKQKAPSKSQSPPTALISLVTSVHVTTGTGQKQLDLEMPSAPLDV